MFQSIPFLVDNVGPSGSTYQGEGYGGGGAHSNIYGLQGMVLIETKSKTWHVSSEEFWFKCMIAYFIINIQWLDKDWSILESLLAITFLDLFNKSSGVESVFVANKKYRKSSSARSWCLWFYPRQDPITVEEVLEWWFFILN